MSTIEEQLLALQQQFATLQAQLQAASMPNPVQSAEDTAMPTPMQSEESTAIPPLHSFGTRPHYEWSPSDALTDLMELDTPLHHSKPLPDSERKAIIESYPPMAHLDYRAPATIPTAAKIMNRGQKYEDQSLKSLQYLLSATFRPLDILIHEMFTHETGNPNLERYSTMLRDIRRLLLHVCSTMTQQRNNLALRVINPSFRLENDAEVNYTLPLDEFQQTLVQQTAARKATREATANRRQRRYNRNTPISSSPSNGSDPSFFRSGPPSQQGGFSNNNNNNSKTSPASTTTRPTATTTIFNKTPTRKTPTLFVSKSNSTNVNRNINIHNNNGNIFTNSNQQHNNRSIQHDYHIPFHTTPPTTTIPTSITPFSADQATLIDQAIQDLLDKSAIEKVPPHQVQQVPGFYSSMFVIPKKSGGVRPVFNLKNLNQYLDAPHFKMETIREVSLMIKRNDYLVSIDLSDAFLHVGLHQDSRRYLRLKWKDQVYQYCTTAFGLASSPFVFTKVCRPILEHLRSRGIRISAYLDDWLLMADSKQLAMEQARQVVSLLQDLGWLINFQKSVLTPTQQLEHLGFVLNTKSMTARLPATKLRDIRRSIKQPDNEDTSGNICDIPCSSVHPSPLILQESVSEIRRGLGSSSPVGSSKSGRTSMVVCQHPQVERSVNAPINAQSDNVRGRQRYWMGLLMEDSAGPWLLDSGRGSPIDQLEGTTSCIHSPQNFPSAAEFNSANPDRQHNQLILHQQARRNSFSSADGISNTGMDMVSPQSHNDSGATHPGHTQQDRGLRVSAPVFQESMDDQAADISTDTASLGTFFHRSIRGQDYEVATKVRVMDAGSRRSIYGCVIDNMDQLPESLRKSSLESHHTGIEQDQARTTFLGDSGGSVLAQCSVVPPPTTIGSFPALDVATTSGADNITQDSPPITTTELDALRVATIRQQLLKKNLNAQAVEDLLAAKLAPTGTNLSYRKNQLRFLEWAIKNGVSFTSFTPVELVNFLSDIRSRYNLQVATLKTVRAAVAHLHDEPKGIRESELINSYIDTMMKQAPPVPIHRPTIDISPALTYARSIVSRTTISIKLLQQKLVFLLAMAAFLRPSDLARIPYHSCSITDTGCLTLQVVAPKETRRKRRIIKPFTIHPHASDIELCPVQCFKALRAHPGLASRPPGSQLFVKSHLIQQPLSSSTISSWLHRDFIALCTSEPNVSIRSLASSASVRSWGL
ncbi:uncharacterized protein ATC70_002402 [Mucor velutinosus]|uniref:Reverse transcriptase domain-containing protein n=1 Tax=Mucor velutinosus TaxID=708070 RepID=A0AAN7DD83_9FUNG|nr:hypothetical protein ATC70_002402 [Mucor velutinosus]